MTLVNEMRILLIAFLATVFASDTVPLFMPTFVVVNEVESFAGEQAGPLGCIYPLTSNMPVDNVISLVEQTCLVLLLVVALLPRHSAKITEISAAAASYNYVRTKTVAHRTQHLLI